MNGFDKVAISREKTSFLCRVQSYGLYDPIVQKDGAGSNCLCRTKDLSPMDSRKGSSYSPPVHLASKPESHPPPPTPLPPPPSPPSPLPPPHSLSPPHIPLSTQNHNLTLYLSLRLERKVFRSQGVVELKLFYFRLRLRLHLFLNFGSGSSSNSCHMLPLKTVLLQ